MRIFIPSLGRPQNVPQMQALAGDAELVWCVPADNAAAYRDAGAVAILEGPKRQAPKINHVLDVYADEWCVFSDDDCRGIVELTVEGEVVPITLDDAAHTFVEVGTARRDRLVMMTRLTNRRFMHRGVTDWGQIVSWLMAVAPGTRDRCDEDIPIGFDLDFAARVCTNYGRIARPNWIQGEYDDRGPQSHYAHGAADEAAFAELCRRWPLLFKGHDAANIYYRRQPKRRAA